VFGTSTTQCVQQLTYTHLMNPVEQLSVQFSSSVPSPQSSIPSHTHNSGIHNPFLQWWFADMSQSFWS